MQLRAFGDNIWIADGPAVTVLWPLQLPTRMVVVRLRDGTLWIDSPIEASRDEMDTVTQLGNVAHLVSPARLHDWRLRSWSAHFPAARCWRRPEIFSDTSPSAWANDLDQVVFRGNAFAREVEFFHRPSRTLLFNDFLQNHWLTGNRVGVPFDIRISIINKELARQSLHKLFSWEFDNLIVAHGDCVIGGAKALVSSAFRFLSPV